MLAGAATEAPFFSREDECRRLLGALSEMRLMVDSRCYEQGEEIYHRNTEERTLYVLTAGKARVSGFYRSHGKSKEATIRLLGPWEVFGTPVFTEDRLGWTSAEAVTECEVVKVPGLFLDRALRGRPELAAELLKIYESMLVEYEELVACFLPRSTEVRLARLLRILLRKFEESTDDGRLELGVRLSQLSPAKMVASTRESVSTAVFALRDRGVIEMTQGRIVVLDPKRLAAIGEELL